VIVGEFVGCDEPPTSKVTSPSAVEVARERLARLSIPVALGARIGHGARNTAIPYGTRADLDVQAGTLVALEGAVS
jgi:muramoyltetrapeptide carboxypeptidase LdcA involved in peptidoglycan recycling